MATATAKALASPGAQASIKSRASALANRKFEDLRKNFREKMKKAAPAFKRDIVAGYGIPIVAGAGGAVLMDLGLKKVALAQGAKGDVIKGIAAIAVGYIGGKFTKSPYVHDASIGAATVNLYKLATRVATRLKTGTLGNIFDGTNDSDLAGIDGAPMLEKVEIEFKSGQKVMGLRDAAGNLFAIDGGQLSGHLSGMPDPLRQQSYGQSFGDGEDSGAVEGDDLSYAPQVIG